ncbi:hypothetical protein QR680_000754 [Steinernema hermaphroditum]|uniref:EF-hand domain-containing protein n=1 Tax=Steinernema hermaphroditum TaxID=289476 RepID=A0AA39GWK6_9BILA|nr:hypothetical protein QR680_000754 [Steinernema hermaphroditum]
MKKTPSERQRNLERQFGSSAPKVRFGNKFFQSVYWALRGCQYWLCFYDTDIEVDVEDLLANPFNTQPPSLDELQRLTGFKREWIMFLYRNFKQKCSNGRMSLGQWRQIFRMIFKNASDYEFADRIFMAIVGDRTNKLITFEDLIICLYDLIQSFRGLPDDHTLVNSTSTTTASFAFSLMKPNEKGQVDESAFIEYTKCIFELNNPSDSKTNSFGGVWASVREHPEKRVRKTQDYVEHLAKRQFLILDRNNDGLITLPDVEYYFEKARGGIQAIVLQTESDLKVS